MVGIVPRKWQALSQKVGNCSCGKLFQSENAFTHTADKIKQSDILEYTRFNSLPFFDLLLFFKLF
jgi:hypothetical protein